MLQKQTKFSNWKKHQSVDLKENWTVISSDISKQLLEEGYEVEKNKITLSSNIKSTGKYSAKIRLHREVSFELSFEVISKEK